MNTRFFSTIFSLYLLLTAIPSLAAERTKPPTRDPNTPGYVTATDLPDGTIPPINIDGNFIIGPTHERAPEMFVHEEVPQGTIFKLTMKSADSNIYPGISREKGTFGTVDPTDPVKLIVTTSNPGPYTRTVTVYVPKQYVPGTKAPFIVGADGPNLALFTALDNLIDQGRVPVMIAISIGSGGGDAQGSQRGLQYDTMSGLYAEFVETEVLPFVEAQCTVKLTKDPEGRATMGCSSGASCAMIMAWYRPDLYRRVLSFSGTFVNQQWPYNPETPHGAWGFHESIIPDNPVKPLRIWMAVGDRDLLNPNVQRDNMHDWVVANERMAKVLADKGYPYQFSFVRNARHCDGAMKMQLLPQALEYIWQGYTGSDTKAKATESPINIVMVGDSTMASYNNPPADRPDLTGWGQVFGERFNQQVTIINRAVSGRSADEFEDEGLWAKALALKPNYMFIQFGHNDQGVKDMTMEAFQAYLASFIDDARKQGAKVILVTPMTRRSFVEDKIKTSLRPYAEAILAVGKEKNVPVIDLHASSVNLHNELGKQGSEYFNPSPNDGTHFTRKGAEEIARLVAEDIPSIVPELKAYMKNNQ